MSDFWHKAFNAAGCDPACHCCDKAISVGKEFRLATVKELPENYTNYPDKLKDDIKNFDKISSSVEVMLCDKCTAAKYKKKQIKQRERSIEVFKGQPSKWGCYRINGKIIH